MNSKIRECRHGLLIIGITALSALAPTSISYASEDDERCQSLQACIEKYRMMIPEWENNIKDFSSQLDEEIPKIEKDFKAFGKEGEKHLRYWLDQLDKRSPKEYDEKVLPETTWI